MSSLKDCLTILGLTCAIGISGLYILEYLFVREYDPANDDVNHKNSIPTMEPIEDHEFANPLTINEDDLTP
jgi:hypothetical protein